MKNVLLQRAALAAERANLLAFCEKKAYLGVVQIGSELVPFSDLGMHGGEGQSEPRARNRTSSSVPDAPKSPVMDVALLSTAVLARVGLLCDSGPSDPPT